MRLRVESARNAAGDAIPSFELKAAPASGYPVPKGPKYLTIGSLGVSILGIVRMVLGRYLMVGHLNPWGVSSLSPSCCLCFGLTGL